MIPGRRIWLWTEAAIHMVLLALLIIVILLLAGCRSNFAEVDAPLRGSPVVRAEDSSTATLSIISCQPNDARAAGVGDIITALIQQDELVVARDGATARLTINLCPGGQPVPAATLASTSRR